MLRKNPREALVLVHTSSLDSFAWHHGKAEASALLDGWLWAVKDAQRQGKLVVLVDQEWDGPLVRRFFERVPEPVTVIFFDENEEDHSWSEFGSSLTKLLKSKGVESVTVGGIWYDPENVVGCVNETARILKNNFVTFVDFDLCGVQEDEDEDEDDEY